MGNSPSDLDSDISSTSDDEEIEYNIHQRPIQKQRQKQ